jgi:ABC-type branched-subunit amino acid transport system ATPase component
MSEADLRVRTATVRFGGLVAVDSVSFDVARGETFGVIGPNGAGKSTLLNAISGLARLAGGSIHVVGEPVHGLRPDQRTRLGVGRTFQAAEVFNDFRVTDYVSLGRLRHQRASLIATALRLPSIVAAERDEARRAREILARFGLDEVARTTLKELPYGVRKLVDLLRVLAGEPRLMLLDEPTSGTATTDRVMLARVLEEARRDGVSIVVVDHDVRFVSDSCDRLLVMNFGTEIATGEPGDVLSRPEVRAAYVGLESDAAG